MLKSPQPLDAEISDSLSVTVQSTVTSEVYQPLLTVPDTLEVIPGGVLSPAGVNRTASFVRAKLAATRPGMKYASVPVEFSIPWVCRCPSAGTVSEWISITLVPSNSLSCTSRRWASPAGQNETLR